MTDWVHCNNCYYQPNRHPKREFKLTSCGHIFCQRCEQSGQTELCKKCQVKYTTVNLSAQLVPEVMTYFEEPANLLEMAIKVLRFQKSHSTKLNEFYQSVLEKYMRAKSHIQYLEDQNRSLKKEAEILKSRYSTNTMTSAQTIPEKPHFSNDFLASQGTRSRLSQTNPSTSSLFFATPSKVHCGSQQYRNNQTPVTPDSDISCSPISQACGGYRSQNGVARSNISQCSYKSSVTPPTDCLRMMFVHTPQNRNSSRN